jgi:16S rRNA C967 or C1407 C5-methylase (RsmB/RsmF family)
LTKPDLTDKEGSRFPEEFISIIRNQLGSEYIDFLEAHKEVPSKSIRLNEFKRIPVNPEWVPVPWCKTGYVLQEKPEFLKDPFFHAGAYYVQEASSMFLDHVVRHIRSDLPEQSLALDVCGAPGGKTLILADALPSDSLVISSEIKLKRRFILEYNIVKWGKENIMLARTNRMLLRDLEPLFDLVLIDAPCSGEGLFRKTNLAIQQWSIQKVKYCSKRQHRILKDNLSLLRPGGYLIYSTCTYNDEENMDQIKWLANNDFESISVPINSDWGIVKKEKQQAINSILTVHKEKDILSQYLRKRVCQNEKSPRPDKLHVGKNFKLAREWNSSPSIRNSFILFIETSKVMCTI